MADVNQYCPRFGQIAVEKGFINAEQLYRALKEQLDDDLANRPHRVLGAICFEHDWMTPKQIDDVLYVMFKNNKSRVDVLLEK